MRRSNLGSSLFLEMRRVQATLRGWQTRAEFDRAYPLHALRHAAVTVVYWASRDLFVAQRFARHASPLTTGSHVYPGDDELHAAVRCLR